MGRRTLVLGILTTCLLVGAPAASAKSGVRATLTSTIPANKSGGDRVAISWRLRDSAGRPVAVKRVFVKIVCPPGTDFTITYATARPNGTYRAVAVVPPGGIGTVTIGTKGSTFPITNPFHRS